MQYSYLPFLRAPRSDAWRHILTTLLLVGIAAGCSETSAGDVGTASAATCVGDNDSCGNPCGAFAPCPEGLFCNDDRKCEMECTKKDLSNCEASGSCGADGRCLPPEEGSTPIGSGPIGSGGSPTGSGGGLGLDASVPGTGSGDAFVGEPNTCASTRVVANRVTPNVVLIVDQSSSMENDFQGAGSRWNVLRSSLLMKPGGLIADLEGQIRFGLSMYSARSGDPSTCPMVTSVAPMLNNYAAIAETYEGTEPLDDTPTGDSINAIIDSLNLADKPLDSVTEPTVFILATDGEPDRCEDLDPADPAESRKEAIDAVARAQSLGVSTYLISVGSGISTKHRQDIANAGLGLSDNDPPATYWQAGDDASLRMALIDIITEQLSCDITLQGTVSSGDPCLGSVKLSDDAVTCDDPDGWTLLDSTHIRLMGDACDRLKNDKSVTLEVSFPCEVEILQ